MTEREKREKVVKGLEFCLMPASREELDNDICSHDDCPYYREYDHGKCVSAVASDALALLKAQEPVEPKKRDIDYGNIKSWAWICGVCGADVIWGRRYCPDCGQAVKWE